MVDYEEAYAEFRVEEMEAHLAGDGTAGYNAAEEILHRHPRDRDALIWQRGDERRVLTYGELSDEARALAGWLTERGVGPGDRVAGLLPKRPELLTLASAVWHLGGVYLPLFTAFGPEAVAYRLEMAGAKLLFTDEDNRHRLPPDADRPPAVLVNGPEWDDALAWSGSSPAAERHGADEPFILLFTSGTTGQPKGVPVPLRALPAFDAYMRFAVDLRPDDVLWNLADPGWAYGLYYGIIGPMLQGQTIRFLQDRFTPDLALEFLAAEGITNFMAAPTAYRTLKAGGVDDPGRFRVRAASSAGEPLNPEVISWFRDTFGAEVLDHYGQTEVGMVVNNHHALRHPVHPGSMGRAMPGYRVAVLDADGKEVVERMGEIAIDVEGSPLFFFPGYWGDASQTGSRFQAGWYLTGDVAKRDEEGYVWFASRADDVILTAGYRVGPFEVESTLMEHPAVAEVAVLGRPDPQRGQRVVAFVVVKAGEGITDDLAEELKHLVKRRLAAHAYPREIHFVEELPKTASGKVRRYVLRDRLLA